MSYKIAHVSAFNNSGMNAVAKSMAEAEVLLGLDSHLVNMHETSPEALDAAAESDIFVAHTHFPNEIKKRAKKDYKLVFPAHGTPEHVFNSAVVEGQNRGYGHGDGLMLYQYWLSHADAIVTHWPRHQAIIQTMVDKNTKVHLVPMGVDTKFWGTGTSDGKFAGTPSVFTAENCHEIKHPLDLFILWPWIIDEVPDACLHACYLPNDQHRWYFPLVNRNGASYGAHISPLAFHGTALRNVFKSVDFQVGLVRYGDFNRLNLEAQASGCKTISYRGNIYADYWVTEGDQRTIAQELTNIIRGQVEPRKDKAAVPDHLEMAAAMKEIYESVMDKDIMPIKAIKPIKKVKAIATNGNGSQVGGVPALVK
jgi:glycosyltransferase involved in cell wall biosynthesis